MQCTPGREPQTARKNEQPKSIFIHQQQSRSLSGHTYQSHFKQSELKKKRYSKISKTLSQPRQKTAYNLILWGSQKDIQQVDTTLRWEPQKARHKSNSDYSPLSKKNILTSNTRNIASQTILWKILLFVGNQFSWFLWLKQTTKFRAQWNVNFPKCCMAKTPKPQNQESTNKDILWNSQ